MVNTCKKHTIPWVLQAKKGRALRPPGLLNFPIMTYFENGTAFFRPGRAAKRASRGPGGRYSAACFFGSKGAKTSLRRLWQTGSWRWMQAGLELLALTKKAQWLAWSHSG
jgi:hypothetical protein